MLAMGALIVDLRCNVLDMLSSENGVIYNVYRLACREVTLTEDKLRKRNIICEDVERYIKAFKNSNILIWLRDLKLRAAAWIHGRIFVECSNNLIPLVDGRLS